MEKSLEEWRAEKAALDAERAALDAARVPQRVNDQRRNLDVAYERSRNRHRHEGGPEPVSREIWRARLDAYINDYQKWKAGLTAKKPPKPSHFANKARP